MPRRTPHDALFQHLLDHADTAEAALASWLPANTSADWSTLRPEPTVTRDVFHGERRTDRVFSVATRRGRALLHVHAEHQRTVDPLMALRCPEYQLRIVRAWQRAQRSTEVPPVLSIVVYHGSREWTAARSYEELVDPDGPSQLGPYQLRARYVLIDLPDLPEEQLPDHPHLRLGLLLLRASGRRARQNGWEVLESRARLLGRVARLSGGMDRVRALLGYATHVFGDPDAPMYNRILDGFSPEDRTAMLTWEQVIEKRGRQQGREEGLERGRLIGEVLTLAKVRFGPVPPEGAARIEAAPVEDLRRWRAVVETIEGLDALLAL